MSRIGRRLVSQNRHKSQQALILERLAINDLHALE